MSTITPTYKLDFVENNPGKRGVLFNDTVKQAADGTLSIQAEDGKYYELDTASTGTIGGRTGQIYTDFDVTGDGKADRIVSVGGKDGGIYYASDDVSVTHNLRPQSTSGGHTTFEPGMGGTFQTATYRHDVNGDGTDDTIEVMNTMSQHGIGSSLDAYMVVEIAPHVNKA